MSSVSEHGEESARRPRLSQIKDLHHLSWKIKHNKSSAAEDPSLIPIASISTSKQEKGFLRLSLGVSARLRHYWSAGRCWLVFQARKKVTVSFVIG